MSDMTFHDESREALIKATRFERRYTALASKPELNDAERAEQEALEEQLTFKWDLNKRTAFFNGYVSGVGVESARKMVASFERHDREAKAKESRPVELMINSPGGFATQGIAIYNLLRASKLSINTTAIGTAYSAASLIFEAGEKRKLATGASLGIHKAWVLGLGDSDTFLDLAERLERTDARIMEIYTERGGERNADAIKAAMKKDTALNAKEAAALGLADVAKPVPSKPAEDKAQGAVASLAQAGIRGDELAEAAAAATMLAADEAVSATPAATPAVPDEPKASAGVCLLSMRAKALLGENPSKSWDSGVKSPATS